MPALIEADGLVKSFGTLKAVDGISLKVQRGEVLGFLGPNGAGKSTTMKMSTGFLEFIAEMRGFSGADVGRKVARAVERTGLGNVLNQTIDTLSKGYKRRVGLAQAILHDPQVLIMDEPTDGLDPNQKHLVRNLIIEMAREKAIIVSTHILEEVEAVCSRAVVINNGRIVADGTAEDLMRRDPNHGAVAIKAPVAKMDAIRAAIGSAMGVARVETIAGVNGHTHLRAVPTSGANIAATVAAVLRDKGLEVDELMVERGRLEDVFRQITTSDRS